MSRIVGILSGVTIGHLASFGNVNGDVQDSGFAASSFALANSNYSNLSFHSDSSVTGGNSGFFGVSTTNAASANVASVMGMAGTVDQLYVAPVAAPGGSDTFTYTLYKNGVATTVTCVVTGSTVAAHDTTHSVTFVAGDVLSILVVVSATGATTIHRAGMRIHS